MPVLSFPRMHEAEMDLVADFIARVLAKPEDDGLQRAVRTEVENLCRKFPLYPERST